MILRNLNERLSPQKRYALAIFIFLIALLLRFLVFPVEAGLTYLIFYPAAVMGFYLCGIGPGVLLVALSAVTANYIFDPPFWAFSYRLDDNIGAVVFLAACFMIGSIVRQLQNSSKQLERSLSAEQKHARALRTLSACNQALVHAENESELLNAICRLIVDEGGYLMAWVGFAENDVARAVRPAAQCGYEEGYLNGINITWADTERGRGPTGTAIRTGTTVVNQDSLTNPTLAPWREDAIKRGYRSSISLPLLINKIAFGALTLYSREPFAFDQDETKLLEELASDLSYGIETLRTRTKRRQVELQKKQYLRFFKLSSEAMCIADPFGCFKQVNPAMAQLTGFSESELVSKPFLDLVHPEDRQRTADEMKLQVKIRPSLNFENRYVCKDGSVILLSWTAYFDKSEGVTYATARDITERKAAAEILEQSELRFRQMAENIHEVFTLGSTDGKQLFYVSPAYEEIWGRSRERLYANPESWIEAIHPDDLASVRKHEKTTPPGIYEIIFRIVRPDGAIRWIESRGSPVRDAADTVVRIASIARDITERKKAEQRFKDLFESTPDAMIIVNRDGEVVLVNAQAVKLFGWCREELLGQKIQLLIPERFRDKHSTKKKGFFLQSNARGMGAGVELLGLRKDGIEFPVEISLSPLETDEGKLAISAIRDITERKAAERAIAYLNRVYAMLSHINTLSVRASGRDELFREACRIAVEEGGFRMSLIGIVDRSTMKIVPVASAGKDAELLSSIAHILSSTEGAATTMVARAIREKTIVISNDSQSDPNVLFRKKYADSGVRSMAALPLIVADEAVGVLALYASENQFFLKEEVKLLTELTGDIAFAIDHIEKRERLDYLAYYDTLTGLANRNLFLERVAQFIRSAIRGGHKIALFLIDVERFKNINDSLGQLVGDALLRQVAEWLTRNMDDATLLARLDADHFAAVLPEVKQGGDLAQVIERMVEAFQNHQFLLDDVAHRIAIKAGIALFPDDGVDAETLFRNAEAALKKAKASGEQYLFYTQKLTETVATKLTLENQLRQALDNEEFVLHYQPKINLASGKITSAEALIRWNDPRTGLVPPGQFIPILEETGMINKVGRWALRKAVEDYLRWRNAGLPAVRIAVNVSPLQLRNPSFVSEIEQTISIDAHAAAGLELEITESLIMADVNHSITSLKAIRAMNVSIAIDDFGTGFSSLSYLAKLPVDTLKIDRAFVIDMTTGPEGLALV